MVTVMFACRGGSESQNIQILPVAVFTIGAISEAVAAAAAAGGCVQCFQNVIMTYGSSLHSSSGVFLLVFVWCAQHRAGIASLCSVTPSCVSWYCIRQFHFGFSDFQKSLGTLAKKKKNS